MYFSSNSSIPPDTKFRWFCIISLILVFINISNYAMHIQLVFSYSSSKFWSFNILNNIFAGFTSVILVVSSIFLSKYMKLLFSGDMGRKVSNRILFISFILAFSFEIKALFPFFFDCYDFNFGVSIFDGIEILLFCFLLELLPMISVLFILRVNSNDDGDDCLPDSLMKTQPLLDKF